MPVQVTNEGFCSMLPFDSAMATPIYILLPRGSFRYQATRVYSLYNPQKVKRYINSEGGAAAPPSLFMYLSETLQFRTR